MKTIAKILAFWIPYIVSVSLFSEYVISRETNSITQLIMTGIIIFFTVYIIKLTINELEIKKDNKND